MVSIKLTHIAPSLMVPNLMAPLIVPEYQNAGAEAATARPSTAQGDKAEAEAKAQAARAHSPTLPRGVESVTPEDSTGEISVRGTAQGIATVRQIVQLLDVPLRKVELDVLSVRLNTADLKQIDANWLAPRGPATLNLARGDGFRQALQKLLDANLASTLLEVRAVATNSFPSAFSSGAFGEPSSTSPTVELQFRPTINNDDTITLLAHSATRAPKNNTPQSQTQVRTALNFRDGDTIMLAAPDIDPDSKQVTATFVTARIVRSANQNK